MDMYLILGRFSSANAGFNIRIKGAPRGAQGRGPYTVLRGLIRTLRALKRLSGPYHALKGLIWVCLSTSMGPYALTEQACANCAKQKLKGPVRP